MLKNLIVLIGALLAIPGAALIGVLLYAESGDVGATIAGICGMCFAGFLMCFQAGEMKS